MVMPRIISELAASGSLVSHRVQGPIGNDTPEERWS
jgi:hypothetical protein